MKRAEGEQINVEGIGSIDVGWKATKVKAVKEALYIYKKKTRIRYKIASCYQVSQIQPILNLENMDFKQNNNFYVYFIKEKNKLRQMKDPFLKLITKLQKKNLPSPRQTYFLRVALIYPSLRNYFSFT